MKNWWKHFKSFRKKQKMITYLQSLQHRGQFVLLHSFRNIKELTDLLLHLDAFHWDIHYPDTEQNIILYPFYDTTCYFLFTKEVPSSRYTTYTLSFWGQDTLLFELFCNPTTSYISIQNDLDNSYEEYSKYEAWRLLEHIATIYDELFNTTEKKELQEPVRSFVTLQQDILKDILSSRELWIQKKQGDFEMQSFHEWDSSLQSIYLYYQDTLYFSACYQKEEFIYELHHQDKTYYEIFRPFEENIIFYFQQLLLDNETFQEYSEPIVPKEPIDEPFPPVISLERKINSLFTSLQREEKWLSEESKHKLSHTLQHDLQSLLDIYDEMKYPLDAEEDMLESLGVIYNSLLEIENEIEKNKLKALQLRKNIINKRD